MSEEKKKVSKGKIDWMITLVPFILIMALVVYLFIFPEQANGVISDVRFFFGDTVGLYYLVIGVGVLIISLFLSFSEGERVRPDDGEADHGDHEAGAKRLLTM